MNLERKILGLSLILLILTNEFNVFILALALTKDQTSYETTNGFSDADFLRRQLEDASPPEGPLLERSYIIPTGMNVSLADGIWVAIAPSISLGYDEEIVKAINDKGLPTEVDIDGASASLDYANLHVTRNLENGEVTVEIPLLCNSPLPSTYYEVKGIKKRIKLYNVTSISYYNVSLKVHELYNVVYDGGNGFSKAMLDVGGSLKERVTDVYLPSLKDPASSEIRISSSYGIALEIKSLEHKVYRISLNGKDVNCHWIRIKRTVKVANDVWRVMLNIGHGGGWITKLWLILRKGEHASEHWIKWIEGDKLMVELGVGGFKDRFVLNFNKTASKEKSILSEVLSEHELKSLLGIPPYEKLDLSRAPGGLNVRFAGEKVANETIWVGNEEYEHLSRLAWRKGDSVFIDSGEAEWEHSVRNQTFGPSKSIKLFYNPLKVDKGGLAHGVTLRNYANSNLSYTLRLRTKEKILFFFFKEDEGSGAIPVKGQSMTPILLVQRESAVGGATLELVNGDRVVAAVRVYLALEATMYWRGFWDGLATKLPGIMVTAGVMIAVGFLIPHAYARPVYYLLLGIGVLTSLLEVANDVVEAGKARDEMLALAEALENRSMKFMVNGSVEHAEECRDLATALRQEALSNPTLNILSNLAIGVSWDEIRIALGLKEPLAKDELERLYKIGYARGRVVGAAISLILYVSLYFMVSRAKAESVGQRLTAGQILRTIVRGIYNWITPAIWDATLLAVQRKGTGFFNKVVDLFLGNKYSKRFGEFVGNLIDGIKVNLGDSGVDEVLEITSSFSKQVINNIPNKESSSKILDTLGDVLEHCSPEEVKEKGGRTVRALVSLWASSGDNVIDDVNVILRRSWCACISILDWLESSAELGKLNEIVSSGLLSKIRGLDINGLEGLKVAFEDHDRSIELARQPELISKAIEVLLKAKYYAFESRDVGKNGRIRLNAEIDPGTYRVRAELKENGRTLVKMWTMETSGTNEIVVPEKYREELVGRNVKLEVCEYTPELHFPKYFSLPSLEGDVFIDFAKDNLKIGYFEVKARLEKTVKVHDHGFGLTVETDVKSVRMGRPLRFRFYEDGIVKYLEISDTPSRVEAIGIKEASLEVKHLDEQIASLELVIGEGERSWKSVYPIKTLKLDIGRKYTMDFFIGNKEETSGLIEEVKKIFGYDEVIKVQEKVKAREIRVMMIFEGGVRVTTSGPWLVVKTKGERVVGIQFYEPEFTLRYTDEEARNYFRSLGIKDRNLIDDLVNCYVEILGYSAEEVEKTGNERLIGNFGELQIIKRYPEKLRAIQYRVEVGGKIKVLDIVLENALVESKYWLSENTYKRNFNDPKEFDDFLKQIKGYNEARKQMGLEKVYLVFGKKVIDDAEFDDYAQKLRNALDGDTSWLVICHGFEEFVKAYGG